MQTENSRFSLCVEFYETEGEPPIGRQLRIPEKKGADMDEAG